MPKKFGPCGECLYYVTSETSARHASGRCHGAPPTGPTGWPVVHEGAAGCAVFEAAGRRREGADKASE